MMIALSILLLIGLLLTVYGIYLLSVMNKDESNNKYLPNYVKTHLKSSGIVSLSVGLIIMSICVYSLNKGSGMFSNVSNALPKSNFGFKFY